VCTGTVSPRGMHTSKTRTRSFSNVLRWCFGAATKASRLAGHGHSGNRHVIATFGDVSGFMENRIKILTRSFRFFSGDFLASDYSTNWRS